MKWDWTYSKKCGLHHQLPFRLLYMQKEYMDLLGLREIAAKWFQSAWLNFKKKGVTITLLIVVGWNGQNWNVFNHKLTQSGLTWGSKHESLVNWLTYCNLFTSSQMAALVPPLSKQYDSCCPPKPALISTVIPTTSGRGSFWNPHSKQDFHAATDESRYQLRPFH